MAASQLHKTFLKRAVASQKLRGVLVDYEVLCESTVQEAAAPASSLGSEKTTIDETQSMKRGSLFQNVRGLLQSMTQSETEQGRRVQTTLAGLPTFMRDRILGDNPNRSDEDDNTASLHDKLVNEMEKKPTKATASKIDILQTEDKADGIRAKYLDKINAIKQRAKAKSTSGDESTISTTPVAPTAPSTKGTTSSSLPTRKVNEGVNAFLSYISLRGLALGVIPPTSAQRQAEFEHFVTDLKYLDAVMDNADLAAFPQPTPIHNVCKLLDLEPKDIVVISSSKTAILSGKAAGSHTCYVLKHDADYNHDCEYKIPNLREFNLAGFLKPLYFQQHNGFTILDAKAIFDVVKGNFKQQLNLREYGTALTKVAKLRYSSNPKTLARLVTDLHSFRKKARVENYSEAQADAGFDNLRVKLMMVAPLSLLEAYSDTMQQSFQMYCKTAADGGMTDDAFYDFLVGYFISPDYILPDEASMITSAVTSTFATNQLSHHHGTTMGYPQFLEGICRVAQVLHGKLVDGEAGTLRKTIETSRLEHSLKVMFDHMQILPNGDTVKTSSKVPEQQIDTSLDAVLDEIHAQVGSLSLKVRKVLQHHRGATSPEKKTFVSAGSVIVIKDVLAIPDFPPEVTNKIECAVAYQNHGQYEMALSQLHEAEDDMIDLSQYRVLDTDAQLFFMLSRGSILDSRQRDLDALQTYSEALVVADGLPEAHPGRGLVLSCLGTVCFHSGNIVVALKCFDKALTIRETLYGENHVDTATTLNNVACCLHAMGQIDAAVMYFRSALSVFKSGFGISHPRVSVAMKNLATAQRRQTRLEGTADTAKNRPDLKHIIAGSKFQIMAFERPMVPVKTKKKKVSVKKK
ncbi:unnamed protein product [Aphanomyces euteiches]